MLNQIPKHFYYFLGIVLAVNLIQAIFTELIFDEAYYWYYSQNMAWGYFDHPPMVALLIKTSSLLFNGELGVRFVSCILSAANLAVLWLLIDNPKKNEYITEFFVLVFSMTLLNAYGFLTLPDTPLLFFTSCFLLTYKKFIEEQSWLKALLLGVFMAALMYSKYHAVLVILFVLLSNLNLVRNKYAWFSVIVALVCYAPHFYWLYDQDFVSIKYHLYERPNGAYRFEKYTLGFFVNLVAIFGLTFPFIYYSLYRTKPKDLFIKALLYLTYGVLLFFFISSFNRRVQTQWIIIICIPLAVLVYNYMLKDNKTLKWIYRLGIINIVLILYLRLGLVHQPLLFNVFYETHGNKDWVKKIRDEVGDMPVVFENSYRNAPMYAFYSGNHNIFSLNNVHYRKNQYSIDDSEEKVRGKDVLYVSRFIKDGTFHYTKTDGGEYHGKYIKNFKSYRKLECIIDQEELPVTADQEINLKIYNPYEFNIPLKELKFAVAYLDSYKKPIAILPSPVKVNQNIERLLAKDTTSFKIRLPSFNQNAANFRIVISENNLYFGLQGKSTPMN
ncbi:ArnT family glycosyltransferase [Maribacter sp. CXY002]|uniref:ArnT family glycosyltransferase n=1 Tax=Maribacter luteocoastalis TaxID=3407671 RepID=UPI003B679F86